MSGTLIEGVAVLATVAVASLSIFQLLLASGRPLGRAAFGGEHRVLPARLRFASALTVAVSWVAAYIFLSRGGLIGGVGKSSGVAHIGIWVLAAVFGLSTAANLASQSHWERRLMAPVALLLSVCCVTLALS